ncbi:MAG TPA: CPBP family intramembrane glutamic endopeptidase [Terriglobales bacterium]
MGGPEVQKNGPSEAASQQAAPLLRGQHSQFQPFRYPAASTRERLIALCRFLSFLLIFAVIEWLLGFLMGPEFHSKHSSIIEQAIMAEAALLAGALLATAILSRLEGRRFLSYGLADSRRGRRFAAGAFWGFLSLTIFLGCLRIAGHFYFGTPTLPPTQIFHFAFLFVIVFLLVGLAEETVFRGYALFTLAEAVGFWPAAVILAALFSLAHAHNGGESGFGIAAAGIFGFVISLSVLRSGSLWWAIGFHFMWDYSQSFIYGVADSGAVLPGHFLSAKFSGPAWITGGSVGPEGSYFILLVLLGLALVIHFTLPARRHS